MLDIFRKEEKKVEYLELIYDLMFVYMIGRNNSLMHSIEGGFIRPDAFLTYVLGTLIVIQIWSFTSLFINRYGNNSIVEHVGIFINMYLLYYMGEGTRVHWQSYYYQYNIAWMLILLNLIAMYQIKRRTVCIARPWEQAHISFTVRVLAIEAGIILVSLPVYHATKLPLASCAMVVGILIMAFTRKNNLVEVDFAHLAERVMLYVVFTFGEMLIGIASYFEGGFTLNSVYYSLMAFLIVAGLFSSYEYLSDYMLDREISTNGTRYMMIHLFVIFGLNNLTAALEFMLGDEVDPVAKNIFLVASFLIYYVFLFATAGYWKNSGQLQPKHFRSFVLLVLGFILLMAATYRHGRLSIAVSAALPFMMFLLLYRYWKHFIREPEERGSAEGCGAD